MLISKWGAKRKRDGAEQPASPAQPPSGKRTRRAAQPASRKIAFVFSGAWPADVEKKHEVRQNFLRGLRTALDPDPDVVAVCFPQAYTPGNRKPHRDDRPGIGTLEHGRQGETSPQTQLRLCRDVLLFIRGHC